MGLLLAAYIGGLALRGMGWSPADDPWFGPVVELAGCFFIVSSWFLATTAASARDAGVSPENRADGEGVHHDELVWRRSGSAWRAGHGRVLARPARADRLAGRAVAARQQRRADPPHRRVGAGDPRPSAGRRRDRPGDMAGPSGRSAGRPAGQHLTAMRSAAATSTPYRALVVDDEPSLTRVVAGYLEHDGFVVTTAPDGEQALAAARRDRPDVVVLDLMLPGIDGIEVCRQLRTFTDAYVIMLTARSEEVDTLIGLSVGADDYMTKPFSPRELTARIRGLLRRPRMSAQTGTDPQARTVGDLRLDPQSRQVSVGQVPVELTRIEFDLLNALIERPKLAYTRRQLIERVWGPDWVGDEHLVDIHVAHIRSKLADDAVTPRFVVTLRGVGYRMGPG